MAKRGPKPKKPSKLYRKIMITLSPKQIRWLEQFDNRSGKIQDLIELAIKADKDFK